MGIGLDPSQMWLSEPLQHGFRVMATGWVLYYDCNPDMILAAPASQQKEYIATRNWLGLPQLRWAADLHFLAIQRAGQLAHGRGQ